jgi:NAD(P)-dependent dehydrogenase (short-subunit alcohol dehydrogenase family)
MKKTWFVTGSARGLGAEIAKAALVAGHNVVATGRGDLQQTFADFGDRVLTQALDVTDPDGPSKAVAAALDRFGRIDVLVNNAGYGQLGIFEESTEDEIGRQFNVNVFGLMRVTRAVLPTMRSQRAGHVINFSSIGGVVPFPLCSLYCASKFAVEGFSASLALDLEPFGINVTVVEPGFFRTDFLDQTSARFSGNRIADYDQVRAKTETQYQEQNHKQLGDPAKLGTAIVRLANEAAPPRHLLLGSDAIGYAREEYLSRISDIDAWERLSMTTDNRDAD